MIRQHMLLQLNPIALRHIFVMLTATQAQTSTIRALSFICLLSLLLRGKCKTINVSATGTNPHEKKCYLLSHA